MTQGVIHSFDFDSYRRCLTRNMSEMRNVELQSFYATAVLSNQNKIKVVSRTISLMIDCFICQFESWGSDDWLEKL